LCVLCWPTHVINSALFYQLVLNPGQAATTTKGKAA